MSDKNESWITNEHGKIIGKDTTEYHDDGSSTTTHQNAHFDWLTGAHATSISGVTENNSDGTSDHHEGSKGCFLTTACTSHAGLPDDCRELTVLRRFRNEYVALQPGGEAMTREYYGVAPAIVDHIERAPDRAEILTGIFAGVTRTVGFIDAGEFPSALAAYSEMFGALRREHLREDGGGLLPGTRRVSEITAGKGGKGGGRDGSGGSRGGGGGSTGGGTGTRGK